MSSTQTKKVIHRVLEDTKNAYDSGRRVGTMETDYADFAGLSLSEFRRAFGNPELTYEQLSSILRGASNNERRRACKTPWAMFMANYLERNISQDIHIRH